MSTFPRNYYIGVKRECVSLCPFKLVSSGITVPFEINWTSSSNPKPYASYSCVFVKSPFVKPSGSSGFRWFNRDCDINARSICESATTTTPAGMHSDVLTMNIFFVYPML